jgi:hypothetical protein
VSVARLFHLIQIHLLKSFSFSVDLENLFFWILTRYSYLQKMFKFLRILALALTVCAALGQDAADQQASATQAATATATPAEGAAAAAAAPALKLGNLDVRLIVD